MSPQHPLLSCDNLKLSPDSGIFFEGHSFIHVWVYSYVAWSRRLHSQNLNILAFRMERSHVYLEELWGVGEI